MERLDEEVEGEEVEGEVDEPIRFSQQQPSQTEQPPPEGEGSGKKKKGAKRKKPLPPIRINLSACKYDVLRIVQRKLGWREVGDEEDWEVYWTDTSVSIERVMKLSRTQKINHFSGMLEICRKRAMARNLMKMARVFPQHYDFFPKTFILPSDREEFLADIRARGKKQVYILKPDAGCQGKGIRLVQGGKEEVVVRVLGEMATPNVVAQHYLTQPLLLHGYKFDLRIYALVLSCDPLRVFLFHEGLARICTEKYSPPKASNLDVSFMHLTNYAVNKKNEAFVQAHAAGDGGDDGGEDASKWCLAQLRHYMEGQGHSWSKVWGDIADLIIKSLCSVQPVLRNNYRSVLPPDNDGFSCFEILGYDIMLDDQLRPWLIEVNHSPSFTCDSPLDLSIKEELISTALDLVRVDPKLIQKTKKAERRAAASRLLEPMQKKKLAAAGADKGADRGSSNAGGGGTAGGGGEGDEAEGGTGGAGAGGGGSGGLAKPRTPEEYEAWRSKVLAARERYEAKHSGNFTRIYPSPDPAKQALYEELLRGAAEIYQSSFQSRAKRPEAADDKKKKDDFETEYQKAERAKAKALRDKLAQQAAERRKSKQLMQAQQDPQRPALPAYLSPPPYLSPPGIAAYGINGGTGSTGSFTQPGSAHSTPQYTTLLPSSPYQYPYPYQHYETAVGAVHQGAGAAHHGLSVAAAQYGSAVGRTAELYGERSDGACSVSSSRPMSAISIGSAMADGLHSYGGHPALRLYSAGRTAVVRSASPAAAAAASGRNSPMPPAAAHGAASGSSAAQQQHPSNASTTQQQQGALPPNPFLGSALRRPASATSRAGGAGGGGGGGAGHEGPPEWGPHQQQGAAAVAAGGAPGLARSGSTVGGGSGSSSAYPHGGYPGGSAALQQLQQLQAAAAALAAAQAVGPAPGAGGGFLQFGVSAGSAHNHVRAAHSSALEAPGTAAGGGADAPAAEQGPGPPAAPGARGLHVSGSRPPSASAAPASIRDKLQPPAAAAAAAATAAGGGGERGAGGSALGLGRGRQHLSVPQVNLSNAGSTAAAAAVAATWDAAVSAAAGASGSDPSAAAQYLAAVRPRPLSAGPRNAASRPLSSGGNGGGAQSHPMSPTVGAAGAATATRRSPSPLGALAGAAGGSAYTSSDMYLLGLTHGSVHPHTAAGSGPTHPHGPPLPGHAQPSSPKFARSSSGLSQGLSTFTPPSPRTSAATAPPPSATFGGSPGPPGATQPWEQGTAAGSCAARAYKQTRAQPTAPGLAVASRGTNSGSATGYGDPYDGADSGMTGDGGLSYQALGLPDGGALASAAGFARHWPGMGLTAPGGAVGSPGGVAMAAAAAAGSPSGARQRSFTTGAMGAPTLQTAGTAAAASSGVGSPVGASRPHVHPPHGGGPVVRVPARGPMSAGAAGKGGAGGGGGGGGSAALAARFNSALSAVLAAAPPPPVGLSGGGMMAPRGVAASSGSVVGVGVGVGGGDGLMVSGSAFGGMSGLDSLDPSLRTAALAAYNRRALTVTGKRVDR